MNASAATKPEKLGSSRGVLQFAIRPVLPFRLDLTVWALRRRPENAVDRWDGRTYRRALMLGEETVALEIAQSGSPAHPQIEVKVGSRASSTVTEAAVRAAVERILGAKVDLSDFYALASRQKRLADLVARFRGMKPPRYPSLFEALINSISCQQVSLNVGMMLLNRLVERFGRPSPENSLRAFPLAEDLASTRTGALRAMGYSGQKERAILELSRAIANKQIGLDSLASLDDAAALDRLLAIRGIGRWSAEYVLLRGLGRLNIFPGDDVGGWNKLQKHLHLRSRPNYAKTRRVLAPWRAYKGLLYFHLLLDGLHERGALR